ncbi:hypothetical protein PS2_018211 [Malus domestica]
MNNKRDQIRRGQFDSERRVKELIDTSEFKEEEGIDVPFFDMQTILDLDATVNFSNANKLGQGGYGPVYKGMFLGGQEIAVKRLSRVSGQGLQEFRNEVVLIAEKIGQMTQIEQTVATPDVMNKYFIGSVLSGGGNVPAPKASAEAWVNLVNGLQKGSLSTRLGIPMIYGIDAVHGHNNVYNATIYPSC